MRKALTALLTTLIFASCNAVKGTVDYATDRTEHLVTHTSQEFGKLKTETLNETREMLSELKTETLIEVRQTIENTMPVVMEAFLNNEAVAFIIVSLTALISLVVIIALIILLGSVRAWWKRI